MNIEKKEKRKTLLYQGLPPKCKKNYALPEVFPEVVLVHSFFLDDGK